MEAIEFYKNWRKEKGITVEGYSLNQREVIEMMNDFHYYKSKDTDSCSHENSTIKNVRCTVCTDCGNLIEFDI